MSETIIPINSNQDTYNLPINEMFDNWFLDYASYVILERAVPYIEDGLKPVQRRILHALKQMDDGRYHKVANVIGQTMQYHPHGDASIGDALVKLGQKDLMIDCQGNWGDYRTGDGAAAPRYIESRLTKFALEVAFKNEITEWQLSYDGRKKEPITLPMKFPLLLFQGVEGIAVGLATKIMPHNFIELLKASIAILNNEPFEIYPDFPTAGIADFSNYNDGLKGGKIKVRCTVEEVDKKMLVIRDLPYGVTTGTLIDSIVKANEKNKIKIKKIVDNTAENVEILIDLPPGISPRQTIDALYAFTECETAISPNACVITAEKPQFLGVSEILRVNTEHTKHLLKLELEYKLSQLEEKWHMSSLEKIFIENRIYRAIEECETWEAVIDTIDKGLTPFKPLLMREVTREDIIKLTEIRIKRISKYDAFKADEAIKLLEQEMKEIKNNLRKLTQFTINYFQNLIDKYGKGRERKTLISNNFTTIDAAEVVINNCKLYANLKDGFIGHGIKKDEYICECSDIDDIIVFKKDGTMSVHRIDEKIYVGKNILHVAVWKKNDERMVYNLAYTDPEEGKSFVKRFNVTSITRDKEYDLTKAKNGKLLYFSANANGEAETVSVQLTPGCSARNKEFLFDFGTIAVKGRDSKGNVLSKWPIRKVTKKSEGVSTLGAQKVWIDQVSGKLSGSETAKYLGEFNSGDLILVVYNNGNYELSGFELTHRFVMDDVYLIEKFNPQTVYSCIYFHGEKKCFFVKRFHIETNTLNTKFLFVAEAKGTKLGMFSSQPNPVVQYNYIKGRDKEQLIDSIEVEKFIEVKGWKSLGNKLSIYPVNAIRVVPQGELI